jgi:hypothetical protein
MIVQKHKRVDGTELFMRYLNHGYTVTIERRNPESKQYFVDHTERFVRHEDAVKWMKYQQFRK